MTTLARTAVDLAATIDARRLGRLVDDAVLAGRLDIDDLVERTAALLRPGAPGRSPMLHVLADRLVGYVPPASELEAHLFEVLANAGCPPPARQFLLPWRTDRPETVDAAYPEARILIEADGRAWHTRVEAFDSDHRRELEAIAHGWVTLRVTWFQLHDGSGLFVDSVRRVLADRSAQVG